MSSLIAIGGALGTLGNVLAATGRGGSTECCCGPGTGDPTGQCCLEDNSCVVNTQAECSLLGGQWIEGLGCGASACVTPYNWWHLIGCGGDCQNTGDLYVVLPSDEGIPPGYPTDCAAPGVTLVGSQGACYQIIACGTCYPKNGEPCPEPATDVAPPVFAGSCATCCPPPCPMCSAQHSAVCQSAQCPSAITMTIPAVPGMGSCNPGGIPPCGTSAVFAQTTAVLTRAANGCSWNWNCASPPNSCTPTSSPCLPRIQTASINCLINLNPPRWRASATIRHFRPAGPTCSSCAGMDVSYTWETTGGQCACPPAGGWTNTLVSPPCYPGNTLILS